MVRIAAGATTNFDTGWAFVESGGAVELLANPFDDSGERDVYLGLAATVTYDATTDASAGTTINSFEVGTDNASTVFPSTDGPGVFIANDAVNLTIGPASRPNANSGRLIVGRPESFVLDEALVEWNSTGALQVGDQIIVGSNETAEFHQTNGTVTTGVYSADVGPLVFGDGPGGSGIYRLMHGELLVRGGLAGVGGQPTIIGRNGGGGSLQVGTSSLDGGASYETLSDVTVVGGSLSIGRNGDVTLGGDASLVVGSEGRSGSVIQGGAVTIGGDLIIGDGTSDDTSVGVYLLNGGSLELTGGAGASLVVGSNGGRGRLAIQTATMTHPGQLLIGDSATSQGRIEFESTAADFTIDALGNVDGATEEIEWTLGQNGLSTMVVTGQANPGSPAVQLQSLSEAQANTGDPSNLFGDGISLEIDLRGIVTSGSYLLIDNQGALPVQGLFEDPSNPGQLFEEGSIVEDSDFVTATLSYVGGDGNDVELIVEVEDRPIGNPGDFNFDGKVDNGDLGLLLGNWGSATVPTEWVNGFDTPVDNGELGGLLANWGFGVATTVPEPGSLALAAAAAAGCLCSGRRSAKSSRERGK